MFNRGTITWETLEAIEWDYVRVVVDNLCSFAFARVSISKVLITTADLPISRALRLFGEIGVGVDVGAMLFDNCSEFCG